MSAAALSERKSRMPDHKEFAIDLAKKAGAVIRANFSLGMKKEWKEDKTPLTVTDTAVNKMVMEAVKESFPDYGLISEEESDYSGQEYAWVCDPVDGTIPFSHGIPISTFMLALVKNGKSILGVVYDPFGDDLYFAEKGKGAFVNGERLAVSKSNTLQNNVVGLLTWKSAEFDLIKIIRALIEKDCIDLRIPSVGYMDMRVAHGEFGAVMFPGPLPWDSAAPKIIVEEAGGKFTDLYGNEPDLSGEVKGHLASNGLLHEELLEILRKNLY